ncbi:MAG: hypothetical protein ACKVU2_12845 [Saprospiraceae bacterium]
MAVSYSGLLVCAGLCAAAPTFSAPTYTPDFGVPIVTTNIPTEISTCEEAVFEVFVTNVDVQAQAAGTLQYCMLAGVSYVAVTGVSPGDVSDPRCPVFSLPAIASGASLSFQIRVRVGCLPNDAGDVRDTIRITAGGVPQAPVLGGAYNLRTPVVVLTPGQNWNFTGATGDVFTRTFTLLNEGFGKVFTLYVIDPFTQAGLQLVQTTGSFSGDTLLLKGNDLGPMGFLGYKDSVVVTQQFRIGDCGSLSTIVEYGWACADSIVCAVSRFEQYNVSGGNSPQPSIVLSLVNPFPAPVPCDTTTVGFRLENTGTTTAYGIEGLIGLVKGELEFANSGIKSDCFPFSNFRIGNVPLQDFTIGTFALPYQLSFTVLLSDPDGPGGLSDADGNGLFDDLPAGQSVVILCEFVLNPACKDCNELIDPYYLAAQFHYDSECGNELLSAFPTNPAIGVAFLQSTMNVEHEFIFMAGTVYDFEYALDATFNGLQAQCPNDSIVAEIILPEAMALPANFQPLFDGVPVPWWTPNDTLVYLLLPAVLGEITVPLLAVCPPDIDNSALCTPSYEPRTYQLPVSIFWTCGNGCPDGYTLTCINGDPFTVDCPRPIDTSQQHGIFADTFTVRRISLGFMDNERTIKVDPATPGLDLTLGIPFDTVLMHAEAQIEGLPGEMFDSAFVQVYYWNGLQAYFHFLGAGLEIVDAETGQVVQCPGLVLETRYVNGYNIWEADLLGLSEPGGCLFGTGVQLSAGDRIRLDITARLTEVFPYLDVEDVKDLRVRFPYRYGGDTLLCETKNAHFRGINPEYEYTAAMNFNDGACDDMTVDLTFYQGLSGRVKSDLFPMEIRPLCVYDSLIVGLAPGYAFRPGSVEWIYGLGDGANGIPGFVQIPLPDPQIATLPDGKTALTFLRQPGMPVTDYYAGRVPAVLRFRAQMVCRPDTTSLATTLIGRKLLCIRDSADVLAGGTSVADADLNEFGLATSGPLSNSRTPTWLVEYCNPGLSFNVPKPLIFIENSLGMPVLLATDVTNPLTPQILTLTQQDATHAVIEGLRLDQGGCRTIQLQADLHNCTVDSLRLLPGFQCDSAPTPCIFPRPLVLIFAPKNALAQVGVTDAPSTPVALCAPILYEVKVINVGEGGMYDIELFLKFPQAGQVPVPGSFSVEFAGQTAPLPDPVVTPDGLLLSVDFSALPFLLEAVPGVVFAPQNALTFRFLVQTNCDYVDGTRFLYSAAWQDVCGEPRATSRFVAPPLDIAGEPLVGNDYQIQMELPNPATFCGENTVRVRIVNPGNLGPTAANEKVRVVLPEGFGYVPSSLLPVHNGPNTQPVAQPFDDVVYLSFGLPAGVVVGDSMVFEFKIQNTIATAACSVPYLFGVQMVQTSNVTCAASTCSIDFVMLEETFGAVFEKPVFTLSGLSGTALPLDAGLERWDFGFQVENLSALPGGGSLKIEIRLDDDQNAQLDPTDLLLRDTAVQVEGLPGGLSLNVALNVPVATALGCSGLWVVLTDTVCSCTRDSVFLPFVRLANAGPDTTVCAGSTASIGVQPLANATYAWLTTSPYLSSKTAANPNYRYTGLFTNSFVFSENLILQTTRVQGCISLDTMLVETRKVEVGMVPVHVLCWGDSTGSVLANVQGASVPVQYVWSTGVGPTDTLVGLPAGAYTLTVADALGCADTAMTVVTQPDSLALNLAVSDFNGFAISCAGANDGSIVATPSGGASGYTYTWLPTGSGPNRSNLPPGTYTLTVTDANGCTVSASDSLIEPQPLLFSLATTDEICLNGSNGTITVSTQGGVQPYVVNGQPAAGTTFVLNGLSTGAYTVQVTDANGCTATADTMIGVLFSTFSIASDSVTCFGGNDGQAVVTGTGFLPFAYTWANGQNQSTATGPAGPYNVTVLDGLGCAYVLQTTVGQPTALMGMAQPQSTVCFGDSTGQIALSAQGSVPPYVFQQNGLPVASPVANLPAGTYSFLLTDANGCSQTLTATVIQPPPIALPLVAMDAVCFGSSTGSVEAAAAGGAMPYSYLWSNGSTAKDLPAVAAGDYMLTLSDANGCTATASAVVEEPEPYEPVFDVLRVPCADRANGALSVTGLPAGTRYGLNRPPDRDSAVFVNVGGGPLVLHVEDTLGCQFEFDFDMPALPEMLGEVLPDTTIRLGDSVLLRIELPPGFPPGSVKYQWLNPFAALSSCDTCATLWVRPFKSANYAVRFTTDAGCQSESQALVQVVRDSIYAPNVLYTDAVMPENQYFTLFARSESIQEIRLLRIFDRWGEAVFERTGFAPNDYQLGWDGRFRGQPTLPGVYAWYAEVVYVDGFVVQMQGDVTVIR